MAKKASVVAVITGQNMPPTSADLNSSTRDTSPWPAPIAHNPMKMTMSRPVSSTRVSTTLAFTLSPTPRKLIAATAAIKMSPDSVMPTLVKLRANALERLAAKAREAVDAEVMPEHITAKATMNVTKWMPNALCGIERGTGRARIFRHQFQIAERGDHGDDEGHQEWKPDRAADLFRHLSGQRVDAGARMSPTMNSSNSHGPITRCRLGSVWLVSATEAVVIRLSFRYERAIARVGWPRTAVNHRNENRRT